MKLLFVYLIIISSAYSLRGQVCIGSEDLTSTPQDSAGGFAAGTVVTFCYTVNDYQQQGVDWFHAAVPNFGAGWDLSTMQPVSWPVGCDGQGIWGWYSSVTSVNTGLTFGPGFFYDSPLGFPGAFIDLDPGNNYGDNCATYSWQFCFEIQVFPNANTGDDLTVTMLALPDNISGSWINPGCLDTSFTYPFIVTSACGLFIDTITSTDVICYHDTTGTITVTAGGGNPPYTYSWLTNQPQTGQTAVNLSPGIYEVYVTDSSGCMKNAFAAVNSAPEILLSTTVVQAGCDTSTTNGTATVTATGGTGNFSFLWSPSGQTTATATGLPDGQHIITVTDSTGCTKSDTITIAAAIPLYLSLTGSGDICEGATATITATSSGGAPPVSYTWSNGFAGASQTVSPGQTTVYTATVQDANGCTQSADVTVNVFPTPVADAGEDQFICYGSSAQLFASGGQQFLWGPASGLNNVNIADPVATPTITTTYTVMVTNANCAATDSVTVSVSDPVEAAFSATPDAGAPPLNVNFADSSTGAQQWLWHFGDGSTSENQNPGYLFTTPGNYTITLIVTNADGCTDTTTLEIRVQEEFLLLIPNIFTPDNDGFNDTFHLVERGISEIHTQIFNRWGQVVYEWNNTNSNWDGRTGSGEAAPGGVYFYLVNATSVTGNTYIYRGTIQLVR